MNKKNLKILAGILVVSIFTLSFINTAERISLKEFGDFTKKAYYKKIFSSKEIRKLKDASVEINDAEEEIKTASDLFEKAAVFSEIKEASRDRRDRKRAGRKERKYLKKAYKHGFRGFDDVFDAQKTILNIYNRQLQKFKNDSSNYHHLAEKFKLSGHAKFIESLAKKRQAEDASDKEKYRQFEKAVVLGNEAIEKQELAFGLYMKDKTINISKFTKKSEKPEETKADTLTKKDTITQKVTPKDSVVAKKDDNKSDSLHTKVYNPKLDPNVYQSTADSLLHILTITPIDSSLIRRATAKEHIAKKYMGAVEYNYRRIDTLLSLIQKEKDKIKREMLKQDAAEIEKDIFVDLLKVANLYTEANTIKYGVYNKYLSKIRPKDNADKISRGKKYEDDAVDLNLMATSAIANAEFQMYASEKYLQYMNAVQIQLSAIQQQENAYAVYLDWPVTPLKKTFKNRYYSSNETGKDTSTEDKPESEDKTKPSKKKYTYNYKGSYMYSVANPKPSKFNQASGTVFKIQIGVFKRLLSLKTFGKFSPITYDEFYNNPFKRFMIGEYRSREGAELALNIIKEKGIKDAFIVAFINGKRTETNTAFVKMKIDDAYKKTAEEEVAEIKGSKINSQENLSYPDFITYGTGDYDFAKGQNLSSISGLYYYIQFGYYKMPKTNMELKNISPLYQDARSGGIKYFTGQSTSYKSAKIKRAGIRKKGFQEAFIVAYNNGNSVSLDKAKKLKNSEQNKPKQPKVYFSVQIGAYSEALSPEKKAEFNTISKKYTISAKSGSKGLIIYTVGQFLTYKEAKAFSKKLKPQYPDIFVVAFKHEQKITVREGLKLSGE
ncbi:MAG: hypothetical protein U9N85_00485 [Bacteroidota bacterium]|nr:hypothetical protein [Bacteroidota bacterium]